MKIFKNIIEWFNQPLPTVTSIELAQDSSLDRHLEEIKFEIEEKKAQHKAKKSPKFKKLERGFFGQKDLDGSNYRWTYFEIKNGVNYEIFNSPASEKYVVFSGTIEDVVEAYDPDWVYEIDEPVYFRRRSLIYRKDLSPDLMPPFDSNL